MNVYIDDAQYSEGEFELNYDHYSGERTSMANFADCSYEYLHQIASSGDALWWLRRPSSEELSTENHWAESRARELIRDAVRANLLREAEYDLKRISKHKQDEPTDVNVEEWKNIMQNF